MEGEWESFGVVVFQLWRDQVSSHPEILFDAEAHDKLCVAITEAVSLILRRIERQRIINKDPVKYGGKP